MNIGTHVIYPTRQEFLVPLALALLFVVLIAFYHPYFHLALILAFVGLIQVNPLSSRFSENLVLLCVPVIGALANFHAVCLTYNSVVLFLLCRSFAIHGTVMPRHIIVYFLMISTWLVYYDESQRALYAGAIMHGIVNPVSFFLLTRKSILLRLGVFAVPGFWMVVNFFLYDLRLVALWDAEICSLYLLWLLGYDKQKVVKRVLLVSLPLVTFAQMYWDVCPRDGKMGDLVVQQFQQWFP